MNDPAEFELVLKAFRLARGSRGVVSGYVEWDADAAAIARRKLAKLEGLTPESIRTMAISFVGAGGKITQHKETRENWSAYSFYYKVIVPVEGFHRGIFVELRLIDEDPDDPAVQIVSAHRQGE
jgi:hypothetical protein